MSDTGDQYHYLVCASGRIIQLPMDQYVIFGRADNCTIRFNDPRVSRQHAELYWDGEHFMLNDLHSANGTWLRSVCLAEPAPLENHDSFRIGTRRFLYRTISSEAELEQLQKESKNLSVESDTENNADQTSFDHDFTGSLASMTPTDLLQMFNMTRRSGLLILQEEQDKAMLYLHNGEILEAEVYRGREEALMGNDAVWAALRFRRGSFHYKPNISPRSDNVTASLSHLLLEGARRVDEEGLPPVEDSSGQALAQDL